MTAPRGVLPRKGECMHVPKGVVVAGSAAAVGAALVIASAVTDHTAQFRVGLVLLLCGLAGYLSARSSLDTMRLIAHQAQTARLTIRERQLYTELGWKAAQLDTQPEQAPAVHGDVVPLPVQRPTPYVRRDGSA